MGREKLMTTQGGSTAPILDVVSYITVAMNEELKKPMFSYWDGEAEERKYFDKPISGIFIGSSFRLSSFSSELGTKGGSYVSDYYFNNQNVRLYKPTKMGNKLVVSGTMDDVELYLSKHSEGQPRKRKVIFLLTKKGLIAVETNMTLAIDQLNRFRKGTFIESQMTLTPVVFSADSDNVTKRAKEILGKVAQKNPPSYAFISIGKPVTDDYWEELGGDAVADMFDTWKNYKMTNQAAVSDENDKEAEETPVVEDTPVVEEHNLGHKLSTHETTKKLYEVQVKAKEKPVEEKKIFTDEDVDDLPF